MHLLNRQVSHLEHSYNSLKASRETQHVAYVLEVPLKILLLLWMTDARDAIIVSKQEILLS